MQSRTYRYFRAVHIGLIKRMRQSGVKIHPLCLARERIMLAGTRWQEYPELRHKLPMCEYMWNAQNEKWGRYDSVPAPQEPSLLSGHTFS